MNCDLCGNDQANPLTQYPAAHVCPGCGFIHVKERRSVDEIATSWSAVYASGDYDPNWPGVKARLFYVAEWLDQNIGLKGKSVLDIGAGNGFFMEQLARREAHPVGLEPDRNNVNAIRARDMFCFEAVADALNEFGQYDLVTLNWTLENCGDCLEMLRFAKRHAPIVSIATGSRILVPFKKPLSSYFGDAPADLHCFRWSFNSLTHALDHVQLAPDAWNDYHERDEMVVLASEGPFLGKLGLLDDPFEVEGFFLEWDECWP